MSPRLRFAIETARLAGDATLVHFKNRVTFDRKLDGSPVTVADREAESIIRQRVEAHCPGEHVLGEEEGGSPTLPDRWVVDPIDGTKSFVAGVPLFATLIAYEEAYEPVLGVAYFPALNELIYAEVGGGAWFNDERCAVKSNADLEAAIICCGGHRSLEERGRTEGITKLAKKCMATRTWCDAYGHCLVATGRADAMIDPLVSRWDVSAVSVIVREAGGTFTDFAGNHQLSDEAISSTPNIHKEIMGVFAP